jgi:ATP-dependent Clp protease ATP-binding subunit ClpA
LASNEPPASLSDLLARRIVGQSTALSQIIPYVQMYRARLNPPDRPAGVFLLLGPTGTGKTRTVEALAEALHGSPKQLLKVDCAEYQSDHEVAKLIGAPPGYVGHRETKAVLNQERLSASVSPSSDLAIVLFDEIEKAAPSFTDLLLGVLDRGSLRLGDNTPVSFEKTLVFLTSNLGAREMLRVVRPNIGFQSVERRSAQSLAMRLRAVGVEAVRKRFSPEFVNRIDAVITYRPLDAASLEAILGQQVAELQQHITTRLGDRAFDVVVSEGARQLLLARGTSDEFGARELRRTVHRLLTQPIAALVADGDVAPRSTVFVELAGDGESIVFRHEAPAAGPVPEPWRPTVLIADENEHILSSLAHALSAAGMTPVTAGTAASARACGEAHRPDVVIVDVVLPDGDGLSVALEFLRKYPRVRVVITTGMELTIDESALCERQNFPVLRKPFLADDAVALVKGQIWRTAASGR